MTTCGIGWSQSSTVPPAAPWYLCTAAPDTTIQLSDETGSTIINSENITKVAVYFTDLLFTKPLIPLVCKDSSGSEFVLRSMEGARFAVRTPLFENSWQTLI